MPSDPRLYPPFSPIAQRRIAPLLLIAAALLSLNAGCTAQRTTVVRSAAETYPSPEQEIEFLDALYSQNVVCNDDALHALLLFQSGTSPQTWEERLAAARALGWVPEEKVPDPHLSALTGVVAGIVCHELGIEGGLTMRMTGGPLRSPVAATKELVALRLLPRVSANQSLSGVQFMTLLRRAELYRSSGILAVSGRPKPLPPGPAAPDAPEGDPAARRTNPQPPPANP